MGNFRRRSTGELLFRVAHHATERGIYPGVVAIKPYHGHADRRFLEYLPEILLARLERSAAIRNETHFTNTAHTRDDEDTVFETHPTSLPDGSPRTGAADGIDRRRHVNSAKKRT